jgi:hypothetical protein
MNTTQVVIVTNHDDGLGDNQRVAFVLEGEPLKAVRDWLDTTYQKDILPEYEGDNAESPKFLHLVLGLEQLLQALGAEGYEFT